MGLIDTAMVTAAKNVASSKKRMGENMNEILGWIDTMDSLPPGSSVGKAILSGKSAVGKQTPGGGLNFGGSTRNAMEGRGRSTGPVPNMMTYKWRDPVDGQLFHLTTAKGTKKYFKPFLNDLAATGYDVDSLGGLANRNIAGTNTPSEHKYGRAIDINPGQNPMGSQLITNMPDNIAKIAALNNLIWGGTWKSKKDAMHFSITGY